MNPTGLEKILQQIQKEAQDQAEMTLREAQEKSAAAAAELHAQAETESLAIGRDAKTHAAEIKSRGESAAALYKRKAVLSAKQEFIHQAIKDAKTRLLQLPAEEYFSLILKMACKYALPQNGELLFNQKDLARLPTGFSENLSKRLPHGAFLSISRETRGIDGGFVLVYGSIEENCTFTALIDGARESLQDRLGALLFPGGR